jgi:LCP family protein required for cell wall assembly
VTDVAPRTGRLVRGGQEDSSRGATGTAAVYPYPEQTGGASAHRPTVVAGGLAGGFVGGRDALLTRDALTSIFSTASPPPANAQRPDSVGVGVDPWAGAPRINVLLIGSDAGADRTGLRTDSLIVASIDTHTGDTVLFGIPRNLEHAQFPPRTPQAAVFQNGFVCPQHACLINALWQFGVEHKDTYYRGEKNPGLTATLQGVEQTLGLTIDNYVMLDLRGFMQFIDAIGGLTINVPGKIPVGGHRDPRTGITSGVTSYIDPGRQRLNGYQTLWFARSRSDSDDYERMRRQRCVIGAVTQQADPQVMAVNLPAVLGAAKNNISTNIPLKDLDSWVTLTLRVKNAHVRSLPFTNAVVESAKPDFAKIRALVRDALRPVATKPTRTPNSPDQPRASPSASAQRTHTPTTNPTPTLDPLKAQDLNAVC